MRVVNRSEENPLRVTNRLLSQVQTGLKFSAHSCGFMTCFLNPKSAQTREIEAFDSRAKILLAIDVDTHLRGLLIPVHRERVVEIRELVRRQTNRGFGVGKRFAGIVY